MLELSETTFPLCRPNCEFVLGSTINLLFHNIYRPNQTVQEYCVGYGSWLTALKPFLWQTQRRGYEDLKWSVFVESGRPHTQHNTHTSPNTRASQGGVVRHMEEDETRGTVRKCGRTASITLHGCPSLWYPNIIRFLVKHWTFLNLLCEDFIRAYILANVCNQVFI